MRPIARPAGRRRASRTRSRTLSAAFSWARRRAQRQVAAAGEGRQAARTRQGARPMSGSGRSALGNGILPFVTNLDTPLLSLSPKDRFTLRDACNGVHIFGGIGSGKTSGSGKALAAAYLRGGMGGLVLCAKPEEVDLW